MLLQALGCTCLTKAARNACAVALLAALGTGPSADSQSSSAHSPAHPSTHSKPSAAITPLERMQDSYAIYSMLIPGEVFAKMDSSQKQHWAIAQITVNAEDINPALAPEAQLKAPENDPQPFREAVADYELSKYQRSILTRNFNFDRPYSLLTPAETDEFRAARGQTGTSSALQQKYAGYPGITYFSKVYFDGEGSAALVYKVDWCGNLCAQAEWVYLEKRNGQWVRRSGPSNA
jgi:hypothetical protein